MSESDSKRFYVYIHRRRDNNAIFYVGKGSGHRAHNKSTRNKFWKIVHRKAGGRIIEIVASFETEEEAFHHELFLIASLKIFQVKLANLVEGGGGAVGWKHTDKAKASMTAKRKGKPLSESHYASVAEAQKRPEVNAKRSASLKAFYADAEKKSSVMAINAAKNKLASVRRKVGDGTSKSRRETGYVSPVVCTTTGEKFECVVDAAKWLAQENGKTVQAARASIQAVLKKPQRKAYGTSWQYLPKKSSCEVSQL